MIKEKSSYERGMKPTVFSYKNFQKNGTKWHRACENINYQKNDIKRAN